MNNRSLLITITALSLMGGGLPTAAAAETGPRVEFNGKAQCFMRKCDTGVFSLVDVNVGEKQGRFEVLEFEVKVDEQPPCNFVELQARLFSPSGAEMPSYPGGLAKTGRELQPGKRYIMIIRFPEGRLSKAGKISVWPQCNI